MPSAAPDPVLNLLVHLDGCLRRILPLTGQELRIGRDRSNDLVLEDPQVSRQHARLYWNHGRLWIEDCGSSLGTGLRGGKIDRVVVGPGDVVQIGPFALTVHPATDGVVLQDPPTLAPGSVSSGPAGDQELGILLSVLDSVERGLSQEELLDRLLGSLLETLKAERAFLYRYDSRRARVTRVLARFTTETCASRPVSESLILSVARDRRARLLTDLLAGSDSEGPSLARLAEGQIQSVVVSPLLTGRRLVGILYLDSHLARRQFQNVDLGLLSRCSARIACMLESLEEKEELSRENLRLRAHVRERSVDRPRIEELVAPGSPFEGTLTLARKSAASDVPVLLTGETGTGKEELARFLHRTSSREGGPFVPINCGAIPDPLLESELFGCCKGAFTGATEDRPGLIELAADGTLFLDEIGELPMQAQVKLLRVLQEKVVQRLGASRPTPVDFRLVVATHKDLDAAVAAGLFRQDLYYRLRVFPIEMPSLRERTGDVALLVHHFLSTLAPRLNSRVRNVSAAALERMKEYHWPGNIRELRNVLERGLLLEEGTELTPGSLPTEVTRPLTQRAGKLPSGGDLRRYEEELHAFDQGYLRRLMQRTGRNIAAMSRESGMTRYSLYRKLGEVGLKLDPSGEEES